MLVGLHVFCSASFGRSHLCLNRRFGSRIGGVVCELTAHLSHDSLGEFGLDGEYVFQITRKIFRPELLARIGASQPGRDAHNVASLAYTSRSEERRVGKECRARWSPSHIRKK